ncbi:MAG TPA: aconitate hydratase AcnA, partial [Polyangia bacterium]|nr:aconitate hydratase AcnA [Polyangia bacterium]
MANSFGTQGSLTVGNNHYKMYRLAALPDRAKLERLPFSLKVLLENLLRFEDDRTVKREDVEALLKWDPKGEPDREIAFRPARVLLQDFTGVPVVVDLAAMRDAITRLGGNPDRINPLVPMDLVIDHSVQVDSFATEKSYGINVDLEYQRNKERYSLLRWGQQAFRNFRAVPPGMGICHQVNLEYLAQVVFRGDGGFVYPDTLVGTDSHTTMINSLGVLGWGVGGIEAEAAMLGQPVSMLIPQVVGFKLHGHVREGATATDVVLTVTQMLRKKGVVGNFVDFYGPGIASLQPADRATIANMAPEYGATMGFFPVDKETLDYLSFSGRDPDAVKLVEAYCKEQGLFHTAGMVEPIFSDTLELDLGAVEPSLAGPKRPQDRVPLGNSRSVFRRSLVEMVEKGTHTDDARVQRWLTEGGSADQPVQQPSDGLGKLLHSERVTVGELDFDVKHGAVVIAAITSCTNTSNPAVMIGAGLVAKNAVAKGLTTKPWVKTSLAPGSRVVTEYLKEAGMLPYLEALGFHLVGYGCTTCIGNSGPLPDAISDAVTKGDLVVASVLSGNRNFEGRINALVRMNFLASPMLVVAYAIAGDMDIDLQNDPVGLDRDGGKV